MGGRGARFRALAPGTYVPRPALWASYSQAIYTWLGASPASQAQLNYKAGAITRCGLALRQTLNAEWLKMATLVPVPPSKSPDHPDYDDRMLRVARAMPHHDIRNLIRQAGDFVPSHERAAQGLNRISLEELLEAYSIDESLAALPVYLAGCQRLLVLAGATYQERLWCARRGRFGCGS